MERVYNDFDKLFFSKSTFGPPLFDQGRMRIPVSNLFFLKHHPRAVRTTGPVSGYLVFEGVVSSHREVTEFFGRSNGRDVFGERRTVHDGGFNERQDHASVFEFGFEGHQESPPAWIDNWVVRAERFILEVEDFDVTDQ